MCIRDRETRGPCLHVVTNDTQATIAKKRNEDDFGVGRAIRFESLVTSYTIAQLARSAKSRWLVTPLQVLPDIFCCDNHSLSVLSDWNFDSVLVAKLRERTKVLFTLARVHECCSC